MATRSINKSFRITGGFTYKGKRLSPGEEMPSNLDSGDIEQLIRQNKITEVDAGGHNIVSKKLTELDHAQVEGILGKSRVAVQQILNTTDFSRETLAKMAVAAEKLQLAPQVKELIDKKISEHAEIK